MNISTNNILFEKISNDALRTLAEYLDSSSLLAMETLCKATNQKIQDAKLWEKLAQQASITASDDDPLSLKERVIVKTLFPEMRRISEDLISIFGDEKQICLLPKIDKVNSDNNYKNFMKAEEMTSPIMRGVETEKIKGKTETSLRSFVAFKLDCLDKNNHKIGQTVLFLEEVFARNGIIPRCEEDCIADIPQHRTTLDLQDAIDLKEKQKVDVSFYKLKENSIKIKKFKLSDS